MAFFAKSLKSGYSHGGFKSMLDVKSLLLCCFKTDGEAKSHDNNDVDENKKKKEKDEDEKNTALDVAASDKDVAEEAKENEGDSKDVKDSEEAIVTEQSVKDEPDTIEESKDNEDIDNVDGDDALPDDQESEKHESDEEEERQSLQSEKDYQEEQGHESPVEEFDNVSDNELNVTEAIEAQEPTDAVETVEKVKTGVLKVKVGFEPNSTTLILNIIDAHDFARPSSSTDSIRGQVNLSVSPVLAYSVHVLVLPLKKLRYKTKMRQGPDPYFEETMKMTKINQEEAKKWCLRFRLYGSLRNSMKQIIGEGFLPLHRINMDIKSQCELSFIFHNPRMPENDMDTLISATPCENDSATLMKTPEKASNFSDMESKPEIQIGLSFNFNTERLTIEIIRGSKLPKMKDNKAPDTFIRVILLGSKGEELFNSKTAVKKATCDPAFEEKFIYQVFMFQLDDSALLIEGYQKLKLGKKFLFGTVRIGSKSSSDEGVSHWKELVCSKTSDPILRWHVFDVQVDPTKQQAG